MKKYIPGIIAVVIAVGLSAFTIQKNDQGTSQSNDPLVPSYYEYQGGTETDFTNYDSLGTANPGNCPEDDQLCWIRVADSDSDDDIDAIDFSAAFSAIDGKMGGTANGSLDDETEDNTHFSQRAE